jgi:hypothetical protein
MIVTPHFTISWNRIYMPAVQTKSTELINILNELRDSEIDPFTVSRLKREISKLSDYSERYMFSGMLKAILGDLEGTIECFEKSLKLNISELSCDNFVIALGNLNEYTLAREKIISFTNDSYDPALLKLALHYSYLFLDLDNCKNRSNKLAKLKVTSSQQENLYQKEVVIMDQLVKSKIISSENLLKIGSVVMKSTESFKVNVIGNDISLQCEDENKLRVKYYVDPNADANTILDMNDLLIDNLIDDDLDLLPVVVTFVRNARAYNTTEQNKEVESI